MQLTGRQSETFLTALADAFNLATFDRMLRLKLNIDRENLSVESDRQQIFFTVVESFNRDHTIERLILAARETMPTNPLIYAFAQEFGLGSTSKNRQELERIIEDSNSFLDPDLFRKDLALLEQRVCRIELTIGTRRAFGTGFLVGSSVILTNHHVIRDVLPLGHSLQATAPKVNGIARFDYKRVQDSAKNTVYTSDGRICQFADNWLVDFSENAPDDQVPSPDQLDYALIRLTESVADDVVDGNANPANPLRRGLIEIPQAAPSLDAGSSLFILQHPKAAPLRLALDTKAVLGLFDNGVRVRYTTNTEAGSSGSPCFTPQWELAALHHSGDPDFDPAHKPTYNEGIPILLVAAMIKAHGHTSSLGKQLG